MIVTHAQLAGINTIMEWRRELSGWGGSALVVGRPAGLLLATLVQGFVCCAFD